MFVSHVFFMGYVLGYVGHILLLVLAILVLVLTLLVLSLFAAPEPDGPCHFAVPFFLSLVPFSPPAGCGGPALLHSAHHVIITTDVGTPHTLAAHSLSSGVALASELWVDR